MTHMLDIIGGIAATAVYAIMAGVLVGYANLGRARKAKLLALGGGWLALITTVAGLGGFAPGVTGPLPAPLAPFVLFLGLLFGAWIGVPELRAALLSIPLAGLVGLNVARVGGIMFILLGAQDRLSEPFASVAGAGDMLVAAAAIPMALTAWSRRDGVPPFLGAWNVLGALDLVVAITIATLSAAGTPFRVFTEGQGTLVMTGLPWIFVPTMLVPLYFFVHFVIAQRIRALRHSMEAVPVGVGA